MAKVIQTRFPAGSTSEIWGKSSAGPSRLRHSVLKCTDVLDCSAASPLLGFIQELSEDRPSEVVGQSAGHIVSDEAFDDGLSEGGRAVFNPYTAHV